MIVEGARCRVEGRDVRVGETEGQSEKHGANRQQHFSPVACLRDTPTVNYTAGNTLACHTRLELAFLKEHRRLLHDSPVTPRTIAKSIFEQNIDSPEKLVSILAASRRWQRHDSRLEIGTSFAPREKFRISCFFVCPSRFHSARFYASFVNTNVFTEMYM